MAPSNTKPKRAEKNFGGVGLTDNLRQTFAELVTELGSVDPDIVVMVGDISHGILQKFAESHPTRYFNIGILEQSMVGIAAGLSKMNFNPVVHTISPFLIERAYEQLKLDFGYQKRSANLVSVGGSFDYSQLGGSHHTFADVSLISHIPGSRVFLPGSSEEFRGMFLENYRKEGLKYFRLTENPHGQNVGEAGSFGDGAILVRPGADITLLTVGPQLRLCVEVADELSDKISVEIVYFPVIKPFDGASAVRSISKTKKFVTVEELSAHDGLFNLVSSAVLGTTPVAHRRLAVDRFLHSYGSYDDLCQEAGLTKENLMNAIYDLEKE